MAWFFQRFDLSYGVRPVILQHRPVVFCILEFLEQNKRSGIFTTQFFFWIPFPVSEWPDSISELDFDCSKGKTDDVKNCDALSDIGPNCSNPLQCRR